MMFYLTVLLVLVYALALCGQAVCYVMAQNKLAVVPGEKKPSRDLGTHAEQFPRGEVRLV